jgi:hypothetical protein
MKNRRWWPLAALLAIATFTLAGATADVLDFFAAQADALANDDAARFLTSFDPMMQGYGALKDNVESLLAGNDIESEIEVVSDDGDATARSLNLDWVLIAREKGVFNGNAVRRRQVVKCKIERQGKQWKVTALEPVEFFKF